MIWIPSIKRRKANEYDIEENIKEEDENYKVIVNIKEKKTGLPLFKFDILLRFAGSGGQYTTDVAQKGSEFKVENENFNKVFYSQG